MADAGAALFRRKSSIDEQSTQWREEEYGHVPGGTSNVDARYRVSHDRSVYDSYPEIHGGTLPTRDYHSGGRIDVQSVHPKLPSYVKFGFDPSPPVWPRVSEDTRPQGILRAFVTVCERWGLGRDDQSQLLGFPPGDLVAQELLGGALPPSSQDIRERVGYIVGISISLSILFRRNIDAEVAWLNQCRARLGRRTPLQCMLQRRMIHLVQVSELLRQERGL